MSWMREPTRMSKGPRRPDSRCWGPPSCRYEVAAAGIAVLNQGRELQNTVAQYEGPLDAILEFAHVARPRMLLECHSRMRGQALLGHRLRIELREKMIRQ